MAVATDEVILIIKRYIEVLEKNDIPIQKALIFGSYAKGAE